MFKFSFPNPDEAIGSEEQGNNQTDRIDDLQWSPSERTQISSNHATFMLTHQDSLSHLDIGNFSIPFLSTDSVLKSVLEKSNEKSSIKLAEELHSDLVPSKYEGGLKIWECTEDLLKWLLLSNPDLDLKGKNVLDLGCGAGLLGIAALRHGANVVFQDYNEEVLDSCTIPNVLLNLSDEESQHLLKGTSQHCPLCQFYSGDWSSFPQKLFEENSEELKFDYILTSETIYNPDNFLKLCSVFQKCLKISGSVFLAAKTYYFGVGGSLREFETSLQKMKKFKSEVCWKCPSGVSREILKISLIP